MGKIGISETFKKSDLGSNTLFEVTIERHDSCCVRVKISQGETCRIGANHTGTIDLNAAECRGLAHLLMVAADELASQQ